MDAAWSCVERGRARHDDNGAIMIEGAETAVAFGDHATALGWYREAFRSEPTSRAARLGLARLLYWRGLFDASDRAYRAHLDEHPDDADALLGHARVLMAMQRFGAARDALDRAADASPNHPELEETVATYSRLRRLRVRVDAGAMALGDGTVLPQLGAELQWTWDYGVYTRMRIENAQRPLVGALAVDPSVLALLASTVVGYRSPYGPMIESGAQASVGVDGQFVVRGLFMAAVPLGHGWVTATGGRAGVGSSGFDALVHTTLSRSLGSGYGADTTLFFAVDAMGATVAASVGLGGPLTAWLTWRVVPYVGTRVSVAPTSGYFFGAQAESVLHLGHFDFGVAVSAFGPTPWGGSARTFVQMSL